MNPSPNEQAKPLYPSHTQVQTSPSDLATTWVGLGYDLGVKPELFFVWRD